MYTITLNKLKNVRCNDYERNERPLSASSPACEYLLVFIMLWAIAIVNSFEYIFLYLKN